MLGKRGPKTLVSDPDLVAAIHRVLSEAPFNGEGYRKVRARLARRGVAVGGKRLLRLMRHHQLLAPRRLGPPNGDPAHAGTIITTRPNEMWGSDALLPRAGRLVLVLRGDRSLQRRPRRLTRGEARRPLGGARTHLPGRTPGLRGVRQRHRARAPPAL